MPGLERFAGGAPAVTDDWPRIEYAPGVRRSELLLELRADPPLRGADAALLADVAQECERLLTFHGAGLHACGGERALWARDLGRVMQEDGRNPYYPASHR